MSENIKGIKAYFILWVITTEEMEDSKGENTVQRQKFKIIIYKIRHNLYISKEVLIL